MDPLTAYMCLCFLPLPYTRGTKSCLLLCPGHENFFRMLNLELVQFPKQPCKHPGNKHREADGVVFTVIFASLSKYRA